MKRTMREGVFLSPKSDLAFHKLMNNELVRKYFVAAVLGIPPEKMKALKMQSPFLGIPKRVSKLGIVEQTQLRWTVSTASGVESPPRIRSAAGRLFHEKSLRDGKGCRQATFGGLHIVDSLMTMGDCITIHIEIQRKKLAYWEKRQLFYVGKVFTDKLNRGESYQKLNKCISISLLDFTITEGPGYHTVYTIKDDIGREYGDYLEIHVVELGKNLTGDPIDDWIRFFNVESEEQMKTMRQTTFNKGIQEAIKEMTYFHMRDAVRYYFESHQKAKRDQIARDDLVRAEGRAEGKAEGRAKALLMVLSEMGCVSIQLRRIIESQKDINILTSWLEKALQSQAVNDFITKCGLHGKL